MANSPNKHENMENRVRVYLKKNELKFITQSWIFDFIHFSGIFATKIKAPMR